jgi:hypothetical protein
MQQENHSKRVHPKFAPAKTDNICKNGKGAVVLKYPFDLLRKKTLSYNISDMFYTVG